MIVGVDVGGSRIRVAAGRDGATATHPTPRVLDAIPDAIIDAIRGLDVVPEAVGVACAGLVDHGPGVLRWMPHATGRDVLIGHEISRAFGVPVWVDNDATAAAIAEAASGAGSGHRMVLMVTVGTGIGAGLVIDGVPERGRGHLGEVGHVRLADAPECACGRTGCWEELASGRALDRAARVIEPGSDGRRLVELARAANPASLEAISAAAGWLAVGIENLVLTLDPDVVVLGGILPAIGSVLLEPLQEHLGHAGGGLAVSGFPPVVVAAHGERAGLEGAIMGAEEALS